RGCPGEDAPARQALDARQLAHHAGEASASAGARCKPRTRNVGGKNGKTRRFQRVLEAAGLGFEPRLPGPEPGVLPLHDPATAPILAADLVLDVLQAIDVREADLSQSALLEHAP